MTDEERKAVISDLEFLEDLRQRGLLHVQVVIRKQEAVVDRVLPNLAVMPKNINPHPNRNINPHPNPAPNATGLLNRLKPWNVLQSAISAVPAVRYALGVAGVGAAAAITAAFFKSPEAAIVGTLVMLGIMVLLLLFAAATQAARGLLLVPSLVLTWALVLLLISSLTLTASSVFFRFPMPYPELIQQFEPVHRTQIAIVTVDKTSQKPLGGALVSLKSVGTSQRKVTNGSGKAAFDGIPVTETHLTVLASAPGFEDGRIEIDASDSQETYTVSLTQAVVATSTAKSQQKKATKKVTQVEPVLTAAPAAGNLNGTWQVIIIGDINNARARQGTFQFSAQDDGEILMNANFRLDDMEVSLSGRCSTVASQVFLQFSARNDASGTWSGKGDFRLESPTAMSGRILAKNGDDVPVALKKLPQGGR
jgi:hypothetical protein